VIVGAGAAGLQWGVLCENAGIDYVILERNGNAGSFFEHLPRKRGLISVNKRHVGRNMSREFALRHDWHTLVDTNKTMGDFSHAFYPKADDLVRYQRSVGEDLNIVYDTTVKGTEWVARADAEGKKPDSSNSRPGSKSEPRVHRITTDKGVWTAEHFVVATVSRVGM
jgi:cation diffusion facilitator CzcD-associated flavoprotein CzcO